MKKWIWGIITALGIIILIIFELFCLPYIFVLLSSLFNNYPVNGKYYIDIYRSHEEIKYYTYYYYQPLPEETAKFENLELYPKLIKKRHSITIEENQIADKTFVINFLLENGYAKIVDETKATDQEIKSQQKAKDNKCGVWGEDKAPDAYIPEKGIIQKTCDFILNIYNNYWWFRWIIAPVISFSSVIAVIIKIYKFIVKSRRIKILFAGDKSAGKTTLRIAFMEPTRSESYLLGNNPTRTILKEKTIRDNNHKKITVYADSIDYPGDDNHVILNTLHKKRFNAFKKTYVILVLSPTRTNNENKFDKEYISDQLYTISKLWTAVIRAKSTTKITKFVVFVNKCDLFTKEYLAEEFSKHVHILKTACLEKNIGYETIIGSSVKRDGIYRLEEIFLGR